ncbi:MAG: response regulator [Nitrososphaera sp.]|uniref:response regulator n=1 Tax=Nitrososphaera sp. TaxID=1971748 RepID=UPI003D6FB2EB
MKDILVVDDNKETTDLVKLMLELNQYGCTTANSAHECLTAMRKSKFDLVLLDMAMPVMNGIEVLQKLKEDDMLAENKIVLFTASPVYTDMDLEKIKKNFGAVDRMRKPFTEQELIHIIETHTA